jgi:hypothetical protein
MQNHIFENNEIVIIKNLETLASDLDKSFKGKQSLQSFAREHEELIVGINFEIQRFIDTKKNTSTSTSSSDKIMLDKLHTLRDRIFKSRFKGVFYNDHTRTVTLILNQFLKGITWFQSESVYDGTQPAYHRIGSCSKKGTSNVTCAGVTIRASRKSNKKTIEKCYIERLIYDRLWQRLFQSQQDESHLDWLKNTKLAYESCHLNCSIEIDMRYNEDDVLNVFEQSHDRDTNMPVVLKITKFKDQIPIDMEIYTKYYNDAINEYVFPVNCFRKNKNNTYFKNTYFLKDKLWMLPKTHTL